MTIQIRISHYKKLAKNLSEYQFQEKVSNIKYIIYKSHIDISYKLFFQIRKLSGFYSKCELLKNLLSNKFIDLLIYQIVKTSKNC